MFIGHSLLQVASRDKEEDMQQSDSEKLLADTLATQGRSPRTQETYTLMLRLFARYLGRAYVGKALPSTPSFPKMSKRTSDTWSRNARSGSRPSTRPPAPCGSSTARASVSPTG